MKIKVDTNEFTFDELLDIRDEIMEVFEKTHKTFVENHQEKDFIYKNILALYKIDNILIYRVFSNTIEKLGKKDVNVA